MGAGVKHGNYGFCAVICHKHCCYCVFSREALDHQVSQELLDKLANQETQEAQYVQGDE